MTPAERANLEAASSALEKAEFHLKKVSGMERISVTLRNLAARIKPVVEEEEEPGTADIISIETREKLTP